MPKERRRARTLNLERANRKKRVNNNASNETTTPQDKKKLFDTALASKIFYQILNEADTTNGEGCMSDALMRSVEVVGASSSSSL